MIGLPGLTLVTVLILASPALLADDPARFRWSRRVPVLALLGLAAMAGFGALRLAGTDTAVVPGVQLRLMQPDVQQDDKFRPEMRDEVLKRYLALSDRATGPDTPGLADVTL